MNTILKESFLEKYKDVKPPLSDIGEFVYLRTYSRYLPEKKRRETWFETVKRVVEYNIQLGIDFKSKNGIDIDIESEQKEAELFFDNLFNLKTFPSGRTLYMGGTEVVKEYPLSNYNCCFTKIECFHDFADIFYLLMLGSGVGVRIDKKLINRLPKVRKVKLIDFYNGDIGKYTPKKYKENTTLVDSDNDGEIVIRVGDSKEGWCDAIIAYFNILTFNEYECIDTIIIDYSYVRPEGARLKRFGGRASGHKSLKRMFEKINKVTSSRNGQLESIDILDIATIISENVVSGGVRRSSMIILCDKDDIDIINAKKGLYKVVDGEWIEDKTISHRRMSNNSVLYNETPTMNEIKEMLESIKVNGEPAFINANAARKRKNTFEGCNPCVSGDTLILTKFGYRRIDSLVNEKTNIWNGYEWSNVIPKITGVNQKMLNVTFSDGMTLKCTHYHKFILKDGRRIEARELKTGDKLIKCNFPIIQGFLDVDEKEMYTCGFYCGDGTTSSKNLSLYHDKIKLLQYLNYKSTGIEKNKKLNVSLVNKHLKDFVPNTEYSIENRLSYLAGIIDSDGTLLSVDGGIGITSINKEYLINLKLMLNTLGSTGTVSLMREKAVKLMPDGRGSKKEYDCQDCYRLIINSSNVKILMDLGLQTHRVPLIANPNRNASRFITVTNIEDNHEIADYVYCFTENKNHSGIFNGVMTAQCGEILLQPKQCCNLSTNNMMAFVEDDGMVWIDKMIQSFELSTRIAIRMTLLDVELSEWNKVMQDDRIIGISMTGIMDMFNKTKLCFMELGEVFNILHSVVHKEAERYCNELGIKPPELMTTIKPEGSISTLPCVSSGIHFSHSEYYVRRVRINTTDPLYKMVEELKAYPIYNEVGQDDNNCSVKVIEFPIKAPKGKTKYDVGAIEQLELYKLSMINWTDHNTSITVHVKDDEWDDVAKWLYENFEYVVGVTFLPLIGETYPLLPYESISKEEYEQRVLEVKPLDYELLAQFEDEEEHDIIDGECANGACPLR